MAPAHLLTAEARRPAKLSSSELGDRRRLGPEERQRPAPAARPTVGLRFLPCGGLPVAERGQRDKGSTATMPFG